MSKFTKGKWIIDTDGNGIYSDTEEYQVAYISYINYNKNKEMQANALLIAAAPEMYEKLQEALSYFQEEAFYSDSAQGYAEEIKTLLARIDGEDAQE